MIRHLLPTGVHVLKNQVPGDDRRPVKFLSFRSKMDTDEF